MREQVKRHTITVLCLFLFLLVLVGGTVLFWDSLTSLVTDPAAFQSQIRGYGLWGQLVFVALMAAQVVLAPIPGHPFEVAGGYCFGILGGTLLTSLGAALGSLVAFFISRFFGAKVVKMFYSEEKLQKVFFLKANRKRNILTLLVFLLPGVPKDMLAYFMGVTEMRFGSFILISTVGRLPGILIAVLGGAAVGARDPLLVTIFVALLFLLLFPLLILFKKRSRANEAKGQECAGVDD